MFFEPKYKDKEIKEIFDNAGLSTELKEIGIYMKHIKDLERFGQEEHHDPTMEKELRNTLVKLQEGLEKMAGYIRGDTPKDDVILHLIRNKPAEHGSELYLNSKNTVFDGLKRVFEKEIVPKVGAPSEKPSAGPSS